MRIFLGPCRLGTESWSASFCPKLERKKLYPDAFLQNVAYRHAADRLGLCSEQGLIVRLPKLADDPAWEVMTVPESVTLADFLAAGNLWRWQRRMDGQPEGDRLASRPSGVHPTVPDSLGPHLRVF